MIGNYINCTNIGDRIKYSPDQYRHNIYRNYILQIVEGEKLMLIKIFREENNELIKEDLPNGFPAVIMINKKNSSIKCVYRYKNGNLHCLHGPSIISLYNFEYYIKGKRCTKEDFKFKRLLLVDNDCDFKQQNNELLEQFKMLNDKLDYDKIEKSVIYQMLKFKPINYEFDEWEE